MNTIEAMVSEGVVAKRHSGGDSRRFVRRVLTLLVASSVLMTSAMLDTARAGGLYVSEFSTTSQANAGAGRGAWVPDASATLHNPAAMTRLDDHGFATGLSLGFGNVRFDSSTGSNGGNQAGVAPIASFSYVHKVSDRVRFGLSFYSISGSVLDPSNDWAGRFQVTELSLLTISISPTVAIRITDWLSIGGGPLVNYGVLNWKLKVDVMGTENSIKLDDLNDWEATGRVGLLLHPREDLALSIYYNGKTDFSLKGSIEGPAGFNPDFRLDLPLVQFVEVSGYWQVTDRIALLATANWEDWSDAKSVQVVVGQGSPLDAVLGFQDTFKIGLGANYRLNEEWLLQTGLMYDSSALKNKDRIAALPIDEQIRFAFGAQHDLSDSLTLGLSFVYINLGKGEIRTASLRGDYERNHFFVFGMTLSFKELPWSGRATFGGTEI